MIKKENQHTFINKENHQEISVPKKKRFKTGT